MPETLPGTAIESSLQGQHSRWVPRASTDPKKTATPLGLPPLVEQLLAARGLHEPEAARRFLYPKLSHLHDPAAVPGVVTAAQRLAQAVRDQQPIVIYGDYDVDGVTATAILWHTLKLAGIQAHTYVPHRLDEGYGLNEDALRQLAQEHDHPLVVTVDCGVTATGPATLARELGVDLIITDHHQPDPDALPEACAVVHPALPDDEHSATCPDDATPELCGAGVALKLAWQFAREHCGSQRLPEAFRSLMVDLVALAALGTVADVVPLVGENRVITHAGLNRVKETAVTGLNALIDANQLRHQKVSATHVGFVLGPRLNAVGRLGHAKDAVKLLTDANRREGDDIARSLARVNEDRRATERAIFRDAVGMIEQDNLATPDRRALVLADPRWHPGVIGIVASRLVERYHRPTVLLNLTDDLAKGSARSVLGVSIHDAFAACAEHLTHFGGHAMAAGLQLLPDHVDAFRDALVAHVNTVLKEDDLCAVTKIDTEATLAECTLDAAEQIERLAPFGRGNPTPRLLIRNVRLARPAERMGQNGKHLRLLLKQHDHVAPAVAFSLGDDAPHLPGGVELDIVVELKVNDWKGVRRPDLHLSDFRVHPAN